MLYLGLYLKYYIIFFSIKIVLTNLIPGNDGNLTMVKSNYIEILEEKAKSIKHFPVTFTLYTRMNPEMGYILRINQQSRLKKSHFNPYNPTRIIIHGWQQDGRSPINHEIRRAYLIRGHFNVIVVDWNFISNKNYIIARHKVPHIGREVANFIDFLHKTADMKFESVYLIGFSLGAHVAGFAGKFVKYGRIDTIFGLDPAGPLFLTSPPKKRLSKTDAVYVETIHTNGKGLGIYKAIGKASFFPNWGQSQPGCSKNVCSHSRSYEFFAESIGVDNRFNAVKCRDFASILLKRCFAKRGAKRIKMGGEPSNKNKASGIYYLQTYPKRPFGIGF